MDCQNHSAQAVPNSLGLSEVIQQSQGERFKDTDLAHMFLPQKSPRPNLLSLWKGLHVYFEAPNGISEQSCKAT